MKRKSVDRSVGTLEVSIVISITPSLDDCEENERGVFSDNLSAVDAAVWNHETDSLAADVISSASTAFGRCTMVSDGKSRDFVLNSRVDGVG